MAIYFDHELMQRTNYYFGLNQENMIKKILNVENLNHFPSGNAERVKLFEEAFSKIDKKLLHSYEMRKWIEFLEKGSDDRIIFAVKWIKTNIIKIYESYSLKNKLDVILNDNNENKVSGVD